MWRTGDTPAMWRLFRIRWFLYLRSDGVQVSGVTGDVIDMGLLQFQLKEFDVENGRYTGHVATFSNSLVFVSPATGLMRFDSAPEKTLPVPASQGGTEPQADERVSIASD